MNIDSLSQVPEHIQIILASGYLGYCLARSGYRYKERQDQLFYGVIVFGLIGYAVFLKAQSSLGIFWLSAGISVVASILSGIFWRKFGKKHTDKFLHWAAITNEDGIPSVWLRLTQDTTIAPTQISVSLKNGSRLNCNDVPAFAEMPVPSFYTDDDGNIAMYVTSRTNADGAVTEMNQIIDSDFGSRVTFIPKEEIARVAIRYLKR